MGMVHEIKYKKLFDRIKGLASTPFFIPILFLFFLLVTIPVITFITSKPVDIRQRAASSDLTAKMLIEPSSGTFVLGQTFTAYVVIDGGGQMFNALQSNVAVSSNLTLMSVSQVQPEAGGCRVTYINQRKTPSISDPSFTGAILSGSSEKCTLYSMTLLANSIGNGAILLTKSAIKSYATHQDILQYVQDGNYTIGSGASPTPSPTIAPTPTASPIPSPTPTPSPTIAPTPNILAPPTVNSLPLSTYQEQLYLLGTKSVNTALIYVNNSSLGVIYPSQTSWEFSKMLSLGVNNFNVYGQDASGGRSSTVSFTISLHRLGDISGDGIVDLTDLSIFGIDWEKTGYFNNLLSDMNNDGIVELTDFSVIAKAYGH